MGRAARSHQDGVSRGCSELPSWLFVDQSKSKMLYKELGESTLSYPNSLGTKAEAQKCTGICQSCSAKGITLQPYKPKLFLPLTLWDLNAFKMQNVLLPSEKGGGRNISQQIQPHLLAAASMASSLLLGAQAQQPKGKQISSAFQKAVMVISPMAKTWQDHGQTRSWCRDHDRRGNRSHLGVGRKNGLHLHLDT